jgi:hypothetical protein
VSREAGCLLVITVQAKQKLPNSSPYEAARQEETKHKDENSIHRPNGIRAAWLANSIFRALVVGQAL